MNPGFTNTLPRALQGLAQGAPAAVLLRELRQRGPLHFFPVEKYPSPDLGPGIPYTQAGAYGAKVFIGRDTEERAVYHELLHVRRIWVERAPQIHYTGKSPVWRAMLSMIQNGLEHTSVVPREFAVYGPRPVHPDQQLGELWRRWSEVRDWGGQKLFCALTGWMELVFSFPDDELVPIAREIMRTERLLYKADRMVADLRATMDSKEKMTRTLFRYLKMPTDEFRFYYCDITERREWLEPV